MRKLALSSCLFCYLGLMMVGCSGRPPLIPVEGEVKLDGKNIDGVILCFYPINDQNESFKRPSFTAKTDNDGKFVLKDLLGKEEAGLYPGEYKVTCQRYVDKNGKPLGDDAKANEVYGQPRDTMPEKYQTAYATPVRVNIPAGKGRQNIVIELTSK